MLNIDLLMPNPNQPRKHFDDESIKELATSIKEYGILNPILVRKKENLYEIIAGERRYRAAKSIGLNEVPVIIKNIDETKLLEIALIENLQRENITPIEEAKTYEKILKSTSITEKHLSELVGKSQPFISNKLRLLQLPEEIKNALDNKKISEKHARSLLTINNESEQIRLLNKIINEKLSVRELDNLIKTEKEKKESDNMNNGNFFPNYNTSDQTNSMSLNQMNMQTMGVTTPAQTNESAPQMTEPIIPTPEASAPGGNQTTPNNIINQLPEVEIQNMESQVQVETPIMPNLNNTMASPIPDFGVNNTETQDSIISSSNVMQPVTENILPPTIETPNTMTSTTPDVNIPLFGENIAATPETAQPVPEPVTISDPASPSIEETPLFNQELNNTTANPNLNESFYDVPVNVSPVIESVQEDKFTQVSQLLSSNNIEYRAYSNETGHCIIIEL